MLKKFKKSKKGFTLIELIIVIAIIAMLAAIAIPKYQKSKRQAAITAHNANISMLKTAANIRLNEMGENEASITWRKDDKDKDYLNYVEKWPEIPKGLDELEKKEYEVTINPKDSSIVVEPNALKK